MIFNSGMDLHQLDVTNGRTDLLLDTGLTNNLALSPDGTRIAYTQFDGQQPLVLVREVADGRETTIPLTKSDPIETQVGNIIWSADGSQLLVTAAYEPCRANWTHSIFRVDLAGGTAVTLLVEKDARQFVMQDWSDPAQTELRLADKEGLFWRLDAKSGALTQEK